MYIQIFIVNKCYVCTIFVNKFPLVHYICEADRTVRTDPLSSCNERIRERREGTAGENIGL